MAHDRTIASWRSVGLAVAVTVLVAGPLREVATGDPGGRRWVADALPESAGSLLAVLGIVGLLLVRRRSPPRSLPLGPPPDGGSF